MEAELRKYTAIMFVLVIMAICITTKFIFVAAIAQSTNASPSPSVSPVSTPQSGLSSNPTKQKTLEEKVDELDERFQNKRIDELEKQANDLESSSDNLFKFFLEILKTILTPWAIVLALTLLILRSQVAKFLEALASNIGKAKIKIGEFEWQPGDLETIISEREKLLTMIDIATIDGDYDGKELEALGNFAKTMIRRSQNLSVDLKKEVILEGIKVALADRKFKDDEYIALKTRVQDYELNIDEVDKEIRSRCIAENVSLPSKLMP